MGAALLHPARKANFQAVTEWAARVPDCLIGDAQNSPEPDYLDEKLTDAVRLPATSSRSMPERLGAAFLGFYTVRGEDFDDPKTRSIYMSSVERLTRDGSVVATTTRMDAPQAEGLANDIFDLFLATRRSAQMIKSSRANKYHGPSSSRWRLASYSRWCSSTHRHSAAASEASGVGPRPRASRHPSKILVSYARFHRSRSIHVRRERQVFICVLIASTLVPRRDEKIAQSTRRIVAGLGDT